jgi:hypothetical protein
MVGNVVFARSARAAFETISAATVQAGTATSQAGVTIAVR